MIVIICLNKYKTNLCFRVLREEWEKREELERLQEEQRLLLEQEREKRKEFEIKQREKENQLLGKIYYFKYYLRWLKVVGFSFIYK